VKTEVGTAEDAPDVAAQRSRESEEGQCLGDYFPWVMFVHQCRDFLQGMLCHMHHQLDILS